MKPPHDAENPAKPDGTGVKGKPIERLANGRFKPGSCPNPQGRPLKRERSFLPRQATKDILEVTEELFTVNTQDGRKQYSAFQLSLRQIRKKALEAHGPSQRLLVKMHLEALEQHYSRHDDKFEILEVSEKGLVYETGPSSKMIIKYINDMRRATRKT